MKNFYVIKSSESCFVLDLAGQLSITSDLKTCSRFYDINDPRLWKLVEELEYSTGYDWDVVCIDYDRVVNSINNFTNFSVTEIETKVQRPVKETILAKLDTFENVEKAVYLEPCLMDYYTACKKGIKNVWYTITNFGFVTVYELENGKFYKDPKYFNSLDLLRKNFN